MKITSSSIQLGAESSALERHERRDSLTLWKGDQERITRHGNGRGRLRREAERRVGAHQAAVSVSISRQALRARSAHETGDVQEIRPDSRDQLKLDILKAMIEKLTGKRIEITSAEEILSPDRAADNTG